MGREGVTALTAERNAQRTRACRGGRDRKRLDESGGQDGGVPPVTGRATTVPESNSVT
nr:hypothetical protein JVH1_5171 [Rhodococcus sp. JVH1]